jgi:O-methyltransferase
MLNVRTTKSVALQVARHILGPAFACVPIRTWPTVAGRIFDVKVPRSVKRQSIASPSGEANINILLALIEMTLVISGDIAECGVFRGQTLLPMALYLRQQNLAKHVIGLDSFEGFDDSVAFDVELGGAADSEKRPGGFDQTSLKYVAARRAALRLDDRVTLVKGLFASSLATLPEAKYSFVHLDCDIYRSYQQCLAYFYPRMAAGGIILFDEYNDPPWPGCNQAVDEFLADCHENPRLIERDGYEKYFIVKE